MPNDIPTPWTPRSRQEDGRSTEKKLAKERGLRLHPNSGSGRIKHDASDDDFVVEIKDARKSFTVNREYIESLHKIAARQGKAAQLVIVFPGITATMTIERT